MNARRSLESDIYEQARHEVSAAYVERAWITELLVPHLEAHGDPRRGLQVR
jgi:hypothetical protein